MDELPQSELGETTLGQYVHTPHKALTELFDHCNVGKTSVVVDLGCGDGRACLIAAKRCGSFGIGVDIDKDLIAGFVEKARAQELSSQIVGIVGDACDETLLRGHPAPTHIYLFILQHRLHLIVPTLQRLQQQHPGLIIMSAFNMPPPNAAQEIFTDSTGMFNFGIYLDPLRLPV